MFNNRKDTYFTSLYGETFFVEPYVGRLIDKLKSEMSDVKRELHFKENELKTIKPILEHKDFKPAVSKNCVDCKFVVISPYNHEVLGCRKNNLCEDFSPKEK